MGSKRTVVVIPAHNEAATVADVVLGVRTQGFPALVVDDGSTDDTGAVALAAGAVVLTMPMNLGVGAALRCGFLYAVNNGFDVAVQCDADGQHDPSQIPALLAALERDHADLVIGDRFRDGTAAKIPRPRRFAMSVLARAATRATGQPIADATSGFRAVAGPLLRQFARSYPAQYLGDTFEVLVASARAGFRVVAVPVTMQERQGGEPSAGSAASAVFLARAFLVVALRLGVRYRPIRMDERTTLAGDPIPECRM